MQFYGYRGPEYRLSPDYGHYQTCNKHLSAYYQKVSASINQQLGDDAMYEFPANEPDCPIHKLSAR